MSYEKYQHEDPRLLGVALAHESLHQDADAPPAEELMASLSRRVRVW
jgi:hypothetical protein